MTGCYCDALFNTPSSPIKGDGGDSRKANEIFDMMAATSAGVLDGMHWVPHYAAITGAMPAGAFRDPGKAAVPRRWRLDSHQVPRRAPGQERWRKRSRRR